MSDPTRPESARPGRGECGKAGRRPTPGSAASGGGAALPSLVTIECTCAAQSTCYGSALGDEDVHSGARTSLDNAPHPAEDGDARRAAARPGELGEPGVRRPCKQGHGLPLPRLSPPVPQSDLFCAVTPMDRRGRLADRSPIRAAGWSPGQSIAISASRDPHLVIVRPGGPNKITRDGHLRLPARIRHACKLSAGDRLFVAVTATPPMVAVYPMATIETIIDRQLGESPPTVAGVP